MVGAKRILNPASRMRLYLCPQRLAHQGRRPVSGRGMAGIGTHCHYHFPRPYFLAYIQTPAGYRTMVVTERSGL